MIGSLLSKKLAPANSLGMNTAQQLLGAGTICLLISLSRSEAANFHPLEVSSTVWLSVVYLILFGSIIAYLSYQLLLSTQTPSLVSTHTYVYPIVSVIARWLLVNEKITLIQFIGLLIILTGVLLTNIGDYEFKKASLLNSLSWIRSKLTGEARLSVKSRRSFINRHRKPACLN
jgi:drug/metabolite transporter (DMT)-like permease